MALLRKLNGAYKITYIYSFSQKQDYENVAYWVCKVANSKTLKINAITIENLYKEPHNENINIKSDEKNILDKKYLTNVLKDKTPDSIVIKGMFDNINISINFDLIRYKIGISMDKDKLIDEHLLKSKLYL